METKTPSPGPTVYCPSCRVVTGFRRTYFWAFAEGTFGETRCCGTTLKVPDADPTERAA